MSRVVRSFLTIFLFGLVVMATPPAARASGYTAYGVGNKSCGAWLQQRKTHEWFQMGQWVLGYVTAYGYYGAYNLRDVDAEALASWIDNYCHKHPLDDLETATQQLVEALKTTKS